jgi:tetratricopeptide (TPR) repeat protein
VITVHDVGVLDGEVFVAMEFVEGKTLRAWLTDESLTPAAILEVLLQAGEGLVAAHAAGLVHRDFKPDNVLVGDDGRVRVTDFGLARADVDEAAIALANAPEGEAPTAIQATLTQTGALLGTPAYMAPEQRRGERADARADIYAFAVTLHEALTGARPGDEARKKRRVPARFERHIARGLDADPAARWPSMRAFLAALARTPLLTGPRVVTAVVVIALGLAAAFGLHRPPLCPPPSHAFDGTWDDARRADVERAFIAAHRESSREALVRVTRALDAYRDAWTATEVDTCQATRVRGEQSERLLDLRMACLDERKHALGAAASVLASADVDVVGRAVEIVDGLPAITTCANTRSLEQIVPLPEDAAKRAAIQSAAASLDSASALLNAGKAARARAIAEPVIASAESLAYPPLLSRALYLRGAALYDDFAATDADKEKTFVRAAASAVEGHDDAQAAEAFVFLIRNTASRPDTGRAWAELADASIRRLGGDDFLEGERLLEMGRLEIGADHPALARTLLVRARTLLSKTRGPDFSLIASIDQSLGNAAFDEGKSDEAIAYHRRALDLRRKLYGRDHPATISSMFNTAEDFLNTRRADDALPILHEIGEILGDRVCGESGWLAIKLGIVHRMKGDPRAALVEFQKALQVYEGFTDKESRVIANIEGKIGDTLLALGRPSEAMAPLARAIAIHGKTTGDEGAGDYLANLARATWDGGGDHAEATALMRRALVASEKNEKKPGATESAEKAREWLKQRGDRHP